MDTAEGLPVVSVDTEVVVALPAAEDDEATRSGGGVELVPKEAAGVVMLEAVVREAGAGRGERSEASESQSSGIPSTWRQVARRGRVTSQVPTDGNDDQGVLLEGGGEGVQAGNQLRADRA